MTIRTRRFTSNLSRLATAPFVVAVALVASPASAQQSDCPPGSWFCADANEKPAAPAGQPVAPAAAPAPKEQGLEPLPLPEAERPPPPPPPSRAPQQPPIIIYQQAPPPAVIYQPPPPPPSAPPPYATREAPPPYYYRPRPAKPFVRPQEWGLNLHIQGALMGSSAANNAGMGGLGAGLRYKPSPYFGLEADVDFYSGHDYVGDQRQETAFGLNALFFVNPKSKTQLYFLAGLGWSDATVQVAQPAGGTVANDYTYFGGQVGVGLEFRLATHFALNLDGRAFIRGRTDDAAQASPEFVDPSTGRTTNTSGGVLLTGGMTFYF